MKYVWLFLLVFAATGPIAAQSYDLVIANGRVMAPETGLDAVRHVGIEAVLVGVERDGHTTVDRNLKEPSEPHATHTMHPETPQ